MGKSFARYGHKFCSGCGQKCRRRSTSRISTAVTASMNLWPRAGKKSALRHRAIWVRRKFRNVRGSPELVAPQGFEPRLIGSEPTVLPLNERAIQVENWQLQARAGATISRLFECTGVAQMGQPCTGHRAHHETTPRAKPPAASGLTPDGSPANQQLQ